VTPLHFVCDLDELEPGTMRRYDLGETPLVVCRSAQSGEVLAMDARCPHQGALLCFGQLTGMQLAAGTVIRFGEIVTCPVHRWDFDVRTGLSVGLWPPLRGDMYPVRVEDGKIYVSRP